MEHLDNAKKTNVFDIWFVYKCFLNNDSFIDSTDKYIEVENTNYESLTDA